MTDLQSALTEFSAHANRQELEQEKQRHPKLSFEKQYIELTKKGITFNQMNKKEAIKLLTEINYYYKLTVYRRNFTKRPDGKYANLDISTIKKISNKDMELRYLLLDLFLDVEHTLKTNVLRDITDDKQEDGYDIVTDFFISTSNWEHPLLLSDIIQKAKKTNSYQHQMYEKHPTCIPVWILFEYLSFGDFIKFFDYYYTKHPTNTFNRNSIKGIIQAARDLRNACAHNNPILFNITNLDIQHPSSNITAYAKNSHIKRNNCKHLRIYDLICLIYLHDKFVKGYGSRAHRKNEIQQFLTKCNEDLAVLSIDNPVSIYFDTFKKVIDNYDV